MLLTSNRHKLLVSKEELYLLDIIKSTSFVIQQKDT